MDAMQNDSANAGVAVDENEQVDEFEGADMVGNEAAATRAESGEAETAARGPAASETPASGDTAPESTAPESAAPRSTAPGATTSAAAASPESTPDASAAEVAEVAEMPQPRAADAEASSGKGKKRKAAPKSKTAAATKSLVVLRDGRVHYADESVVVLDLDEAAHPDTDVHDVVDKLSELRDALESPGRAEAVTLVAELIQAKALA
jgi:hypothetical protein